MVTKFLIHRLARSRSTFTGEVHSEVAPSLARVVRGLGTADQRRLAGLLQEDVSALILAGADVPEVSEHLRRVLLPDATVPAQQELEAGVFLAAGKATRHLCYRLPANLLHPAHIIRGVEPETPPYFVPVVHLDDFALGPLLFELLPCQADADVHGVPGLRHTKHPRSVELYLVDAPNARLILAGVDDKRWTDALDFLRYSVSEPISWLSLESPVRLTDYEQRHLDARPRVFVPSRLASAMFRRIRLLRDLSETRLLGGIREQRVIWSRGPSCTDVAISLLHPVFGLPGKFNCEWLRYESARLTEVPDTRHGVERHRGALEVSLQRDASPSEDAISRFRSKTYGWEENPWLLWERKVIRTLASSRSTNRSAPLKDPVVARAAHTGEALVSAAKGVGPDGGIGLDRCSDAQRRFRALLAVHVFNAGQIGAPPKQCSTHTITAYSLIVSPRYDELVLFTNASDNLTGYLARRADARSGIPGMRIQSRPNGSTFRLIHPPTGGRMTITSCDEADMHVVDEQRQWLTRDWLTADIPISRKEQTDLASIPPMSDDITRMLAALLVRICTKDPRGRWALGTWDWDPLRRTPPANDMSGDAARILWGANDDWELKWEGYPFPEDVIASLANTTVGLDGVDVTGSGQLYVLALNDAVVRLRPWIATAPPTRLGARR